MKVTIRKMKSALSLLSASAASPWFDDDPLFPSDREIEAARAFDDDAVQIGAPIDARNTTVIWATGRGTVTQEASKAVIRLRVAVRRHVKGKRGAEYAFVEGSARV